MMKSTKIFHHSNSTSPPVSKFIIFSILDVLKFTKIMSDDPPRHPYKLRSNGYPNFLNGSMV